MLLSLTVIAAVAAAALAFINYVTAEPIAQAQKAKKEAAVKAVLPAFDRLEEVAVDGVACNKAYDADGKLVGMAIEAGSEKGFGGHLGAKAGEWFQKGNKGDVIGKNPSAGLKVKKDGGEVDAISGSTITSRAFCELINNAYETFQKGGVEQ